VFVGGEEVERENSAGREKHGLWARTPGERTKTARDAADFKT
jgi:hypothetical protein